MSDVNQRLHKLRAKAENINTTLINDLLPFYGTINPVFRRLPGPDSDEVGNVTTTCSCLMSMATSDKLIDFFKEVLSTRSNAEAQDLITADKVRNLITTIFEFAVKAPWTSSGLPDDNAFSSLIVLRTAGLLVRSVESPLISPPLTMKHTAYKQEENDAQPVAVGPERTLGDILINFASEVPESFGVGGYPSTPAIAYWFVDAVEKLMLDVPEDSWEKITFWASQSFARQVSLVTSQHDAMKDPVAMTMAACLATRLRRIIGERNFRKRDELIQALPTKIEVEQAILRAFSFQEKSGIWPKYFPLFNYRKGAAGSNYLFSFEILEVIVHEFENSNLLEDKAVLDAIERALNWCESNRLEYKDGGKIYAGWNSGGQMSTLSEGKPESWATAVVHMFLRKLRSALSLLIKNHTLVKYGVALPRVVKKSEERWNDFIDSPFIFRDERITVKKLIEREVLNHLEIQGIDVLHRKKIEHRRSALLFGPPGTSKTSLVRAIAEKIGWPLVELNPSDFLKDGLENIYSQANKIFEDLKNLWQTVVFFDEMDALAQKREEGIDVTRQFLTTSMLPKLSMLHDEARVLFFMATNHQRNFDEAIKRPGRFDLLICMAPPQWIEKVKELERFWTGTKEKGDVRFVQERLSEWVPPNHRLVEMLDLFTFSEFKSFLESIRKGETLRAAVKRMDEAEFSKHVQEWGENYIALNPKDKEKPRRDLSLREEFEEDKHASSIQ